MPAEAVKTTEPPGQNVVAPLAVIVAVMELATVTLVGEEVVEQLPLLTVTLYCPELFTIINCVVAPFDHKYDAPAEEVNVTDPPWQKVVAPLAVIEAVAELTRVTVVAGEVAEQLPLFTVTLKEPELLTVIDFVVAPFDHK